MQGGDTQGFVVTMQIELKLLEPHKSQAFFLYQI